MTKLETPLSNRATDGPRKRAPVTITGGLASVPKSLRILIAEPRTRACPKFGVRPPCPQRLLSSNLQTWRAMTAPSRPSEIDDTQMPGAILPTSGRPVGTLSQGERRLTGCDDGTARMGRQCRNSMAGHLRSHSASRGRDRDNCEHPAARAVTTSTNSRQNRAGQPEASTTIRSPFSEITASVRLWCCHVLTSRDKRVDCRARARKTQFLPKTPALMICDLCKVSRVQANSFRVRKVVWLGTSTGLKNRSTLEGYTFRGELAFTSLPVRG